MTSWNRVGQGKKIEMMFAIIFTACAFGIWLAVWPEDSNSDAKWGVISEAKSSIQATPETKDKGSCHADYTQWTKMPEGRQKVAKLVYWKKEYGTLNFHDNCRGQPRHISAAEAIQ